jgi:hypothetical protein
MAQAGMALAARLLDAPPRPMAVAGPGLPGRDPLLLVGRTESVEALLARLGLPPPPPQVAGKGSARVWAARDESGRAYGVVAARDAAALEALHRPLPHYGRQSWLVFEAAKATDKGIFPPRAERLRVQASTVPGAVTPAVRISP